MADLGETIQITRDARDTTAEDQLDQEISPNIPDFSLRDRYIRVGAIADSQRDTKIVQELIHTTAEDHPDRAMLFNHLGIRLSNTYFRTGAIADLDKAIQAAQEAVDITPENHIYRAIWLNNLGVWFGERFVKTKATADLEKAIQVLQEAVNTTPKEDLDRVISLNNLATRLVDRYSRTGDIADQEDAIRIAQEAIDITPEDHPNQETLSSNYGLRQGRYVIIGAMANLKEAIQVAREALNTTPKGCPDRAMLLNHLGVTLGNRHIRIGMMDNLEEAIQVTREAIDITPGDHLNRVDWLNNLGIWLGERYLITGVTANLEEAIRVAQEAVNMTPEGHPDQASRLHNLGVLLGNKHVKTGAMADLEEAIRVTQKAVNMTQEGRRLDRIASLQNLSISLRDRYLRTGAVADLEEAIRVALETVHMFPKDHPERASQFHNLGLLLRDKYLRTQAIVDLEEAIQVIQKAIDTALEDTPDRASSLQSLGNSLRDRYLKTGAIADLEEAIQVAEEAIDTTPEDHPDQAGRLHNLGLSLSKRYSRTRSARDLKEAVSCYQSALRQSNSYTITRILAGKEVLRLHVISSDWQQACEDSAITIGLIPKLTLRSLENSDKQYWLSQVVGLACDAAAAALHAGKAPLVALNLLEQGRGVLAASLEEMRTDILDLHATYPELADQFCHLRNELEQPITQSTSFIHEAQNSFSGARVARRSTAGHELDNLIVEIRKRPGFEDFLLPPNEENIRTAAKYGPIVVVNVSEYRCDALLVEQHQIRSLALLHLKSKEIKERAQRGGRGSPQVLAWLWDTVAKPILDALGFIQPPSGNNWPHIWWIPTGHLSKFPLHAAGRHGGGSVETVLDKVMSSYSSSIKAIIQGRQRRILEGAPKTPDQALLVAMRDTPENTRLGFATKEIEMVRGLCKSISCDPIEPIRRKQDILLHLPNCKIFHFAGHGYTDDTDPSQSSLLLEDWKSGRLTVANLLQINLRERSPFLAYLSACGTGEIKAERLFDESIHLISAYQLAGFRHVIGTLWEVNDESCVDMANITYEEMKNGVMTDESVCLGLHKATRQLRDHWLAQETRRGHESNQSAYTHLAEDETESMARSESDPLDSRLLRKAALLRVAQLHWVPYVHFGV